MMRPPNRYCPTAGLVIIILAPFFLTGQPYAAARLYSVLYAWGHLFRIAPLWRLGLGLPDHFGRGLSMLDIAMILLGYARRDLLMIAYVALCERITDAMLDLVLGGAVSLLLLIYLVWALVRPEDL